MTKDVHARLIVRIKPNARQSQIVGCKDGALELRIAAPPVEGKANEALIKFLSEYLGVSKSRLSIEKGQSSRMKTISVQGLSQSQIVEWLEKRRG